MVLKLLEGNRDKISRSINAGVDIIMAITDVLRGVVQDEHVKMALKKIP